MKKKVPAQQRYPEYKRETDLFDWFLRALSASCMALGVYIWTRYPVAFIDAVIVIIKISLPLALLITIIRALHQATLTDQYRTRRHRRQK